MRGACEWDTERIDLGSAAKRDRIAMYIVEKHAGRLIETRLGSPLTRADVESTIQHVRLNILALPGKAVCCADLTQLDALPPDAIELFLAMFTRDNPRIERSAFLLARAGTALGLQLMRMFRQAGSPARMTFDDKAELATWLAEVLIPAERLRLNEFLATTDKAVDSGRPKSSRRFPQE